jgi:integrase
VRHILPTLSFFAAKKSLGFIAPLEEPAMANLYKKTILVRDPETGEKVKRKSRKWWGRYRDEKRKEKRVPLALDKHAALAMLNARVRTAERIAAGILDEHEEHRKRPIEHHLADFEKHLKARGISAEHVRLVTSRARRVVESANAGFTGDLTAFNVEVFLGKLREGGKSIQTSNHYLRAIKQFTRWLVKNRRAADDPLSHLSMLNPAVDRRHYRRPLSVEELTSILRTANAGPIVLGLSGVDRAMLYAVAAYTGLRARELGSLTPSSFHLGSQPPTVTVEAAYSKHRRQDVLPLHASLVELLRPWILARPTGQHLWPGRWAKAQQAGAMLKIDLKAAGVPYVDGSGRYADFHALRHTFITNMARSGVSPRAAQSLARHSTITLTMNAYTSLAVNDLAVALAFLPPIPVFGQPTGRVMREWLAP